MGTKHLRSVKLPEKLKQIREVLELSQNELISKMGLDGVIFQGNVSQYELGRREPPLPVLLQYAKAIGVSTDILIDDELDLPELLNPR
jgi:transcriptional regulator with XRE-family HTH domain